MDATDSTPRPGQPSRFARASSSTAQPSSSSSSPAAYHPSRPHYPHATLWDDDQLYSEKNANHDLDLEGPHAFHIPLAPSIPSNVSRPHYAYPVASPSIPFSSFSRSPSARAYTRPRSRRIFNLLKPWIPIILYAITSLGFLAAVGFWKAEVFGALDELAQWLRSDVYVGYTVIFFLIFLTTIPPLPLYSTLIILSGYTFGAWPGAILSYWASLAGALAVFCLSRACFRESIACWLSCTKTVQRVVRAIEKRPQLLFLIRLAPYPFNVMNCLLAAAPSLSLRTYTLCTALSLVKLIIHTTLGASIRSFAAYHVDRPDAEGDALAHYATAAGIVLCIAIFVYLSIVARRAVDDELDDDAGLPGDAEERMAFLATYDSDMEDGREMTENPTDMRFVYAGSEEAQIGL